MEIVVFVHRRALLSFRDHDLIGWLGALSPDAAISDAPSILTGSEKDVFIIYVFTLASIAGARVMGQVLMNSPSLLKASSSRMFCPRGLVNGHRHPAILHCFRRAIGGMLNALAQGLAEAISRLCDDLAAMCDPEIPFIGSDRVDIPAVIAGTCRRLPPPIPVFISSNRRERSPSPNRLDQLRDQGVS